MANFTGTGRTNYVEVEDKAGLEAALENWDVEIVHDDKGRIAILGDSEGLMPSWGEDEEGDDVEFDIETLVMPFVKEGEVLVVMEAGSERARYVSGFANAYVRKGDKVLSTAISLGDIYEKAAETFSVEEAAISRAEY